MQPGQFLVNKDGEKRQIYFVNEFIVIFEAFAGKIQILRKSMLETEGWSPLEEPWRPTDFEIYYYLTDRGDVDEDRCFKSTRHYNFRSDTHNVFRNKEDAELYKQKLIERMGRKEKLDEPGGCGGSGARISS